MVKENKGKKQGQVLVFSKDLTQFADLLISGNNKDLEEQFCLSFQ